ncbi:MAG: transposase [Candidatus Omnitrophica bacterium]|nr:transposase [Candidatus Omnitrophota bacterium]
MRYSVRKEPLVNDEFYHIFSKSIAGFRIFNDESEFLRMIKVIRYYQIEKPKIKFSDFIKLKKTGQREINHYDLSSEKEKLVEIVAYCLMPTHIHLILQQIKTDGISAFMNKILNSYTRFFNIKHKRKGPLWETRFKSVLIKTNEQMLHLTRYIHLNPVATYLVDKPEEWFYSSYREYILEVSPDERLCNFYNLLEITPSTYRAFVEDRIAFQRELERIKDLLLE